MSTKCWNSAIYVTIMIMIIIKSWLHQREKIYATPVLISNTLQDVSPRIYQDQRSDIYDASTREVDVGRECRKGKLPWSSPLAGYTSSFWQPVLRGHARNRRYVNTVSASTAELPETYLYLHNPGPLETDTHISGEYISLETTPLNRCLVGRTVSATV